MTKKRAPLTEEDLAVLVDRVTQTVKEIYTPAVVATLVEEALGKLYNDSELQIVIRSLARDEGETAAKTYIAHLLGATVTVAIGSTLDGVTPAVPPLKDAKP